MRSKSLRYQAKIEAKADGTLTFSAVGTPLSDFLTNRSGFVVLHPLEGVVGKPVEVVHVDGKREKRNFPKIISPGQPIFEIRSLKHTVMPGVTATVLMEGNKFEMEDHRNWMDASYKTYVCSLLDPWPYTLKKDEAVHPVGYADHRGKTGVEDLVESGRCDFRRIDVGERQGPYAFDRCRRSDGGSQAALAQAPISSQRRSPATSSSRSTAAHEEPGRSGRLVSRP